jgi:hypothetical protein
MKKLTTTMMQETLNKQDRRLTVGLEPQCANLAPNRPENGLEIEGIERAFGRKPREGFESAPQ